MKLYFKVALTIFFIIFILLGVRTYQNYLTVNEKMKIRAQKNANVLSSLIVAHDNIVEKNPNNIIKNIQKLENDVFAEFVKINTNHYTLRTFDLDKLDQKNSLNAFEKKGVSILRKRKEKTFYSEEIEYGKYFYIIQINRKKMEFLSITIDAKEDKQKALADFYISSLSTFLSALAIFALFYLTFQEIQSNDKKYMEKLQDEVYKKTKNIEEKNERITYQLYYDTLTKLPNRVKLLSDLEHFGSHEITLTLVNIDNFKEVNDFFGHGVGDEVLVSFGAFLRLYMLEFGATLYKLHADEYALIWTNTSKKEIEQKLKKLNENIKNFVIITEDDYNIEITVTAGAAIGNENILAHADMVLKRAKKERIPFLIFNDSMKIEQEYQNNITWTQKLKKAIKDDKIVPFCQPISRLQDKKLDKYEVLARLIDDDDEIISPYFFLEIAKKNRLYTYITHSIVQKAFKQFKNTDIHFSINISILDVSKRDTVEFLLDELRNYPKPENITFEILESEGIENYSQMIDFIKTVKSFGCKIAIDDFGAGYSNFSHLLNLKVDLIKIDASLIRDIDTNKDAEIIVRTIVTFAKVLNIETCAEFVHSEAVYNTLLAIDVTYIQGYYISEPLPIEQVT